MLYLASEKREHRRQSPGQQTTFPICQLHGTLQKEGHTCVQCAHVYTNQNKLGKLYYILETYQSVHLLVTHWKIEKSEFDPQQEKTKTNVSRVKLSQKFYTEGDGDKEAGS
jgi:hypothetical protein